MADINPATVEEEMDEILQVATQLAQDVVHTEDHKPSPPSLHGGCTTAPTSGEEDNMDYDSDDDDDSKSNHSNSNQMSNTGRRRNSVQKGTNGGGDIIKRSHHNVLERKRRDLIKDSFTKLKDAVPSLLGGRSSRAQILKKAADFIQQIHQRNDKIRAEIESLVKKNLELETKMGPKATGMAAAPTAPASVMAASVKPVATTPVDVKPSIASLTNPSVDELPELDAQSIVVKSSSTS